MFHKESFWTGTANLWTLCRDKERKMMVSRLPFHFPASQFTSLDARQEHSHRCLAVWWALAFEASLPPWRDFYQWVVRGLCRAWGCDFFARRNQDSSPRRIVRSSLYTHWPELPFCQLIFSSSTFNPELLTRPTRALVSRLNAQLYFRWLSVHFYFQQCKVKGVYFRDDVCHLSH